MLEALNQQTLVPQSNNQKPVLPTTRTPAKTTPITTIHSQSIKLNSSLGGDLRDARIHTVSTAVNPLQFTDLKDRAAATFAKAQRIVNNPKFKTLPQESKDKILSNYYDRLVAPAYARAGFKPPDKDLWVRAIPSANVSTDVASFYLNRKASAVARTSAATIKEGEDIANGISYAGVWLLKQQYKSFLGLTNFFGNSSKPTDVVSDNLAINMLQHKISNISHSVFDQADFWLQTHPAKSWQDHVSSFVGENLLTLPLYEAIGAGRILGAGKLQDVIPGTAKLTSALAKTKKGMFLLKRLGEAHDAFIGSVVQNPNGSYKDKLEAIALFTGLGSTADALAKGIKLPTNAAIKAMTAKNLEAGGKPFQETITDEAEAQLSDGIHKTAEEIHHYYEDDPVKASIVTSEKITLSAMGRQKYGKAWRNLSHSQRNNVRAMRNSSVEDTIAELPLHSPDMAKKAAEDSVSLSSAQNPKLALRVKQFEQQFGIKVSDAMQAVEKNKIETQNGIKNSQAVIQKISNQKRLAPPNPQVALARLEGPKKFNSLKLNTSNFLKHVKFHALSEEGFASIKGEKTREEELVKFLRGMSSEDFVQELQDNMGMGSYKFENPDHALIWANYFRKNIPKPLEARVIRELQDRHPEQNVKNWNAASDNLERHMQRLAVTGRLFTQKNIFRSTNIDDWADKTRWMKELDRENEDIELDNLMGKLKKFPKAQLEARKMIRQLQLARRVSNSPEEDRELTRIIENINIKELKTKARKSGD